MSDIVVRIAPSPTGNLHIGTARTALFNYLFAKKHGGKFLIRIEDTDKERSKQEYEKNILDGLEWLGIKSDYPIIRQSERIDIYRKYHNQLKEAGLINEEKSLNPQYYATGARASVLGVAKGEEIKFHDLIRGEITFPIDKKRPVVWKPDDTPTYNFAVVIDDHEMNITHVIRGEDHISNTPRQIEIIESLNFKRPLYAHIPLILAPDRSKLSKRQGASSIDEYKDKGYLPEAVINYLALLGWNPGTDQEIFTLEELINVFDLSRIHKGGAIFDEKKLAWVNRKHFNLARIRNR